MSQATVARETIGLYFYVIAPEKKIDGTPWEPGVSGGLPDIFVCFRATTRRWDCAPPCQDSRTCAGRLNVVPVDKPLTIGVFDRDIQQNDPMYNLNIENARRCTSGDGNPCRFAYDGRIAVTLSQCPVGDTLLGACGDDSLLGGAGGDELEDGICPRFSIIFLHGRGDNGQGWEFIEDKNMWNLPKEYVHFEFPPGPLAEPVNGKNKWYNIDEDGNIDQTDVETSENLIKGYIQEQMDEWEIPSGCILLAGHSQGAAMALHTGLRSEKDLLGILTLSASLREGTPFGDHTDDWKADKSIPIFMSHGGCDYHEWSGLDWGKDARDLLRRNGYEVEWVDPPVLREHKIGSRCKDAPEGLKVFRMEFNIMSSWLSHLIESKASFNVTTGK